MGREHQDNGESTRRSGSGAGRPRRSKILHGHGRPSSNSMRDDDDQEMKAMDKGTKRKRVKKNHGNEDDNTWIPPPPLGGGSRNIDILHDHDVPATSDLRMMMAPPPPPPLAPPPPQQAPVPPSADMFSLVRGAPAHHQPQPPSSVFQEMPTVIQSFAETQNSRRVTNPSNFDMSLLTTPSILKHSGGATATTTTTSKTTAAKTNEDQRMTNPFIKDTNGPNAIGATTMSLYDLFFASAAGNSNGSSNNQPASNSVETANGNSGKQSLKRKRRESGRSNRRAGRDDEQTYGDYDMLRFGVDSVKLVPQGLVDRVDAKMSRRFIAKAIDNHVRNWMKNAGFGGNFVLEITTLLTAYYPCNYPTILDEVLVGFLFKRPEFIDSLVTTMIDKLHKTGESATAAKYPVIDAFARQCVPVTTTASEQQRHELACLTLLRCLVEHNTEKFILSPWIAVCAMDCRDDVVEKLWRALLNCCMQINLNSDQKRILESDLNWKVDDADQQIFELLREEKQRSRSSGSSTLTMPRLSHTFVRVVLFDEVFKHYLVTSNPFRLREALELFFTMSTTYDSCRLLAEWVKRSRGKENKDIIAPLDELLKFFVDFTGRLSVKKTNWFMKHIVQFILSSHCQIEDRRRLLLTIIRQYMPLILGRADQDLVKTHTDTNGDGTAKHSELRHESDQKAQDTEAFILNSYQLAEKHTTSEIVEKMELLLETLSAVDEMGALIFIDSWAEIWCSKSSHIVLPWSYVFGLMKTAIKTSSSEPGFLRSGGSRNILATFHNAAVEICCHYFAHVAQEFHNDGNIDGLTTIFTDALGALLGSTQKTPQAMLLDVVNALSQVTPNSAISSGAIFRNAVISSLARVEQDMGWKGFDPITKRNSPTKNATLLGQTSNELLSSNLLITDLHVLTSLSYLASLQNSTGSFVRYQLSHRSIVCLLVRFLNSRNRKSEILVNMIKSIITGNKADNSTNDEWARQQIVQEIVRYVYYARAPTSSKAIDLLHAIARGSKNRVATNVLWVVLRQCTAFCCGCYESLLQDKPVNVGITASSMAELVKVMLLLVPSVFRSVMVFAEQEISSCSRRETRVNFFLLLFLQKVVGGGELLSCYYIPPIRLAVYPIASTGPDHIRVLQLQVLKAVCSRLQTMQGRKSLMPDESANGMDAGLKSLVCNERIQSDLRAILSGSREIGMDRSGPSRASIVLAEGIVKFVDEIRRYTIL